MFKIGIRTAIMMWLLSASFAFADERSDSFKYRSGSDYKECVFGEAQCGIGWEGRGLFSITTDAPYALLSQTWPESLDLQQAYICCTEDTTRTNVCEHKWTTWEHCSSWVDRFYQNPLWRENMRNLPYRVQPFHPSYAAAEKLKSCIADVDDIGKHIRDRLISGALETLSVISIVTLPETLGVLFVEEAALEEWAEFGLESLRDNIIDEAGEEIENGSDKAPTPELEEIWGAKSAEAVKVRLKYFMKKSGYPESALNLIDQQFDGNWEFLVDTYQLIGKADGDISEDLRPELNRALNTKLREIVDRNRAAYDNIVLEAMDASLRSGGAGTQAFTYMTEHPAEGCIAAIFDTLRDASRCLWNNPSEEFCDR
jgi:hypothetical protein